jgi:hypothetical protein
VLEADVMSIMGFRHQFKTKAPFGNWSMGPFCALRRARAEGEASSKRREMTGTQQTPG